MSNRRMHALLASLGTDGDVLPFVGLGLRLRARGHRVTLAANEQYESIAGACGFGFGKLASNEEMHRLLGNPDVWHPVQSGLLGAKWGRTAFRRQYEVMARLAGNSDTVLIAYAPMFAARIVQEKLARPLVTLLPMPWMLLSRVSPPALPMAARFPVLQSRRASLWVWRVAELATDLLLGRRLNALRASLGLKRVRGIYRWSFSPELTIGLFPDWYAAPQRDWPRNTRTAGFGLHDGGKPVDKELLEFCRRGAPPVAFTFGTGIMHARELFRKSFECCQKLGLRALFLTRYPQQLPEHLPPSIRHCDYAPFSQIFPECAAVVHHGGAGTTAQALAAALPQLILPLAWDQPDNAFRVRRLGAGQWISPRGTANSMATGLQGVMLPAVQSRCQELAQRFESKDGYERAAEWVEEMATRRG
jgi:rhamnosyltransferase subunit B